MKLHLLFFLFFTIISTDLIGIETYTIEEIKSHLKKSEHATTITFRGDLAIIHAVLANNLFNESNIKDIRLEKQIQLKFVGAFRLVNQPKNATKHLKRLLRIAELNGEFAQQGFLLNAGRLASDYLKANELDSAKKYCQIAHNSAEQEGSPIYISSTLNNLGMLAQRKGNWEEAIEYYNRAENALIEKTEEELAFLTSINDNKANYYFQKKDTAKGVSLLTRNIEFLKNNDKYYKKLTQYCFRIIEVYNQLHYNKEINEQLKLIKQAIQFGKPNWQLVNKIKLKEVEINQARKQNINSSLISHYTVLDSLKTIQNSINEQQRVLVNNSMADYFLASAEKEIAREKEKASEAKSKSNQKTFFHFLFTTNIHHLKHPHSIFKQKKVKSE